MGCGESKPTTEIKNPALKRETAGSQSSTAVALSPKAYRQFPVFSVTTVSHDSKRIIVAFPKPDYVSGMTTSSYLLIRGPPVSDGEPEERAYTPITLNNVRGRMEFIIKAYPTGVVSNHLISLKEGDYIEMKGPYLKLEYRKNMKKQLGFLCGGTGIAPCLQVIRQVLSDMEDHTQLTLVFANRTESDILLKSDLDDLASKYRQFKVIYLLSIGATDDPVTLDINSMYNQNVTARITPSFIEQAMPKPSKDSLVYVCGPPPFMKAVCGENRNSLGGYLGELSYTDDMVCRF